MSLRRVLYLYLVVAVLGGAAVFAPGARAQQQDAPDAPRVDTTSQIPEGGMPRYVRPETPEQRLERLAVPEDPGINPDPDRVWGRFGRLFKIYRFDKKWAVYPPDRPGFVRPIGNVNFVEEIYQENDKYVWVWIEEIDAAQHRADVLAEKKAKVTKEGSRFRGGVLQLPPRRVHSDRCAEIEGQAPLRGIVERSPDGRLMAQLARRRGHEW
jgi:hypothetical protein